MKRALLLLILVLLAVVLLARWVINDPGYLVLVRDQWQIEMTLGFATLALALLLAGTVAITLLLAALWDLVSPFQISGRWGRRLARRRMVAGFHALVAGKWKQARRLLSAAAVDSDWAVPALLGAAMAADQLGDKHAMHAALKAAANRRRGALPAGLAEAWTLQREGYANEAMGVLRALQPAHSDNPHLLRMLRLVMEQQQDWDDLVDLLPRLKPLYREPAAFAVLERQVWHGLMKQLAEHPGDRAAEAQRQTLRQRWKSMPGHLQTDPALRAQYAGYLAQLGDGEGALALVRKDIERHWDDRLAAILEAISNVAPERLLAQLEQWLADRPGNAALLLTAGRVALRAQLWGKARDYFEAAGNAGSAVAMAELARLYQALNQPAKMEAALAKRLALLEQELPELPLPAQRGSV